MDIKNQQGTTLIELLVAMAIIGIMSAIFVSQINLTDNEELNMVTERVAADLKQVRNLATSRVINDQNVYPTGGYGIYFDDTKNTINYSYYVLFADDGVIGYDANTDVIISKYIFPNSDLTVDPKAGGHKDTFYFIFVNEHTIATDIDLVDDAYDIIMQLSGNTNTIKITDPANDGSTWGNMNILYGE